MSEFDTHIDMTRTDMSRHSSGFTLGGLAGLLTLGVLFVVLNVYDMAWMTAYWKIVLSIFTSMGVGLVFGLWMHRMTLRANAKRAKSERAEQALIKERELVKFQATKAWPPK